jgi:hypothetical protein
MEQFRRALAFEEAVAMSGSACREASAGTKAALRGDACFEEERMNKTLTKMITVLMFAGVSAIGGTLVGCEANDNGTSSIGNAADEAGDAAQNAAENAREAARDAADATSDAAEDAADKARDAASDAADAAKDAADDARDNTRDFVDDTKNDLQKPDADR